jgi:hypothetical protein
MAIKVIDVIAAAVAAYRANGNAIVNRSGDLAFPVTNVTLVKQYITEPTKSQLAVTDEDIASAEEIKSHILQKVLVSRLSGKAISDFVERIGLIVEDETTSRSNIGILVWTPKVYNDLITADAQQHELTVNGFTSKYLGSKGDHVVLEFTTVIKRWNKTYQCYRYTGHDSNGNLVGFLSGTDFPATVKLKARIKATEDSKFSGGKTTYINYAKEIK